MDRVPWRRDVDFGSFVERLDFMVQVDMPYRIPARELAFAREPETRQNSKDEGADSEK